MIDRIQNESFIEIRSIAETFFLGALRLNFNDVNREKYQRNINLIIFRLKYSMRNELKSRAQRRA